MLLSDNLWVLTVVAALSSLAILGYFVLMPIMDNEGTMEDTKEHLDRAASKFDELRQSETTFKETVIHPAG